MSEAIVPLSSIDAAEIRERVRAAGVVGAGGAGFPTHIKLQARVDTVLVNAAECEPMLKVDQQLMPQQADRMIRGLLYGMAATGAKEGIFEFCSVFTYANDTADGSVLALDSANANEPIRIKVSGKVKSVKASGCETFTKV